MTDAILTVHQWAPGSPQDGGRTVIKTVAGGVWTRETLTVGHDDPPVGRLDGWLQLTYRSPRLLTDRHPKWFPAQSGRGRCLDGLAIGEPTIDCAASGPPEAGERRG